MGDGNLSSYSKYSAGFRYTSKYIEYIEYVRDTLKSFGIEQVGRIYKQYHKDMNCYTYSYCSRAYSELLIIRKQWYPEGKKIVPKDIGLTPLTIRQWYIGDGCLMHQENKKPSIKLCTYGFTISNVEWLIKQLIKLGLKVSRKSENSIYVSTYSVKNFLEYIGECPVKCYRYKWEY